MITSSISPHRDQGEHQEGGEAALTGSGANSSAFPTQPRAKLKGQLQVRWQQGGSSVNVPESLKHHMSFLDPVTPLICFQEIRSSLEFSQGGSHDFHPYTLVRSLFGCPQSAKQYCRNWSIRMGGLFCLYANWIAQTLRFDPPGAPQLKTCIV